MFKYFRMSSLQSIKIPRPHNSQLFCSNRYFIRKAQTSTKTNHHYETKRMNYQEIQELTSNMNQHQIQQWIDSNADLILQQVIQNIEQQSLDNMIAHFVQHSRLLFKGHVDYMELQRNIIRQIPKLSSEELPSIINLNLNEVQQQYETYQLIYKRVIELIITRKSKINHLAHVFPDVVGTSSQINANHFLLLKKYLLKNMGKAKLYELGLIFNGIGRIKQTVDLYDNELNEKIIQRFLSEIDNVTVQELNVFLGSSQLLRKYEDNEIYQRVDEIVMVSSQIFNDATFNDICRLVLMSSERCHNTHYWDTLIIKVMESLKLELEQQQNNNINLFVQSLSYLILATQSNTINNQLSNIKEFISDIFIQQLVRQKEQQLPLNMGIYLEIAIQMGRCTQVSKKIWFHLAEIFQGQFDGVDNLSFMNLFRVLIDCHDRLPNYFVISLMDDIAKRNHHIDVQIYEETRQILLDKKLTPSSDLQKVFDMYKLGSKLD